MQAPVPVDVFQRLAAMRVSLADRLEYRVRQAPRTTMRLAVLHWIRHRRMASGSFLGDLVSFPGYLRRLRALRPR